MLKPEQTKQLKRETFVLWKLNTGCGCGALLIALGCGYGIWQIDSWWWRAPLILVLLFAIIVTVATAFLDIVPWIWALLRGGQMAGGNMVEKRREKREQ